MKFGAEIVLACLLGATASSAVAHGGDRKLRGLSDDYCVEVTLTGTGGGPIYFGGTAGSGTLVTYGKTSDNCRGTNLQFDMGRGTSLQLSKLGLNPVLPPAFDATNALDAIFFTHIHNDHTDDFYVYMSSFYQFLGNDGNGAGPPNGQIDVVCSEDVTNPDTNVTTSCQGLVESIGDPMIASGEVAQRESENGGRADGGPSDLANLVLFDVSTNTVQEKVWSNTDESVTVDAVRSVHIGGHSSYRINTPVGTVVIGGDASYDPTLPTPPSAGVTSTSQAVEDLAERADVLVQSAIHPAFGPGAGTEPQYPPAFYSRQSNAPDIGAMAKRAKVRNLMLTHLIPAVGAETYGIWSLLNGALTKQDWEDKVVNEGKYNGNVIVGEDLASIRIPCP
mmetsp:Transcript_7700/g.13916  ORF Transcript_7700/g.13916 Transcript_7700/m.13916 type:complete len:392 (-) Transcript_7700:72-1247(-)|eukprot:CAMPEP_0197462712 /NCGR_PEP_ID=MMETSP1175-20131217/59871_1 /TAXON_ID=1003142 /ORGANISM="Triceratium dubium, Strain CCMP147" /LENGTH=391 /DNA_ID=CAMNT_0042998293 /DNA_START=165 /DNA_END=1340 /DNA_ORIENTATION=-